MMVTESFPTVKLSPPDPRVGLATAWAAVGCEIESAENRLRVSAPESKACEIRLPTPVLPEVFMIERYRKQAKS